MEIRLGNALGRLTETDVYHVRDDAHAGHLGRLGDIGPFRNADTWCRDHLTGAFKVRVRHFNGEPWETVPAAHGWIVASALTLLLPDDEEVPHAA